MSRPLPAWMMLARTTAVVGGEREVTTWKIDGNAAPRPGSVTSSAVEPAFSAIRASIEPLRRQ